MIPIIALQAWILRPPPGESRRFRNITIRTSMTDPDTVYVSTDTTIVLTRQGYWWHGELNRYPTRRPDTVLGGEWAQAYDHGINSEIKVGEMYVYATLPYAFNKVSSDVVDVLDNKLYPHRYRLLAELQHSGYRLVGSTLRSYPERYAFMHTETGFERLEDYQGRTMLCAGDPHNYILALYGFELTFDEFDGVWYDDTYLGDAVDLGLDP